MCGIVGYIGEQQAAPILLDGLSKLEYRGYDSAGVAVYDGEKIQMVKATGRLKVLEELTQDGAVLPGTSGIGHTRWATHGSPSDANAHPHFNKDQSIVVVHNGIIENYVKLKKKMESRGYQFVSETDTEVIAHMLESLALLIILKMILSGIRSAVVFLTVFSGQLRVYPAVSSS